ncbi:MAG: VWA-like domain-containing protein [Lachnospiraceae bacterium]|nr:VWA-like domain-containing protein [Lachnospiraceae bacterium]
MDISEQKKREYTRRIMHARLRCICSHGFYGMLLMNCRFGLGDAHDTAWPEEDDMIMFNPDFLEGIDDAGLDYAMLHILLHIVLASLEEPEEEDEAYDEAIDIVANSNILCALDGNEAALSLSDPDSAEKHRAPDGSEGYEHTVEEVRRMILSRDSDSAGRKEEDSEDGEDQGNDQNHSETDREEDEESEDGENRGDDQDNSGTDSEEGNQGSAASGEGKHGGWDFHPHKKQSGAEKRRIKDDWTVRVCRACEAMAERMENINDNESGKDAGSIPMFAERLMKELRKPQTDWRTVLDEFIQEDIIDYSFMPPDRRMDGSPFFLPDFNEKDDRVEKILFMIDTSGSMSDSAVTMVYSEVKGAIDQFGGKLQGWLGFFDAAVVEPQPFTDEDEFSVIRPQGGGGTSFSIIFSYVREFMEDDPPVSIVILTDGYAPMPDESEANGIPVLWIITNEEVTPPWGKIARVEE